ncbi:MAG: HAMP domain-containing protein [Clostridiales bacterium]|nr:HAMP domain-containing protein [Clostridiales bacterium]
MKERMRTRKFTLFMKYFLVFSLVILLSFAIIGCSLLFFVASYWKNEKVDLLQENAKNVAVSTADILSFNRLRKDDDTAMWNMITSILKQTSSAIDADAFIINTNGSLICKDMYSPSFADETLTECPEHSSIKISSSIIKSAKSGNYIDFGDFEGTLPELNIIAAEPISVGGQIKGTVFVIQPIMGELTPFVMNIAKMFFFAALFSMMFAFILIYVLAYRFTKPLREMANATKLYSGGDFSYRVPIKGNDELADLCRDFNAMASALSITESARRSFVANVSHELKTPITTIGGFIEGVLDGTIPEEKREHYLKIVSDEIKRLSRLITTMLNMSKIEAGNLQLKPETYDISNQIVRIMLGFEQLIENKNIEIVGLDDIESISVTADEDLINQVIYNLVDNAVKFTNPNGSISFSISRMPGGVSVAIRNTGAGIPPDELPRVFERFYKVDKSRSLDSKSAGLGLYIVKSVIEMHHGDILVSSRVNEYTEFKFTLPSSSRHENS